MKRVLLVEDDPEIASYISEYISATHYQICQTSEGRDALKIALSEDWDAILLDRMLPNDVDGLDILKALRAIGNRTPVIMISALGKIEERVRCLKSGADDYLPKPFVHEELEARLEAILRRSQSNTIPQSHELCFGNLRIDLMNHSFYRSEERITLNPREFKLLTYLVKNAGKTVTRSMVLENVWEYDFLPETNIIDVHISHLRQKIDMPPAPSIIRTVRGVGYRIEIEAS